MVQGTHNGAVPPHLGFDGILLPLQELKDICLIVGVGQHVADFLQREFHAPKLGDQAGLIDLALAVVAVAGLVIHPSGDQEPFLVVKTERLDRQAGDLGELADGKHRSALV